jgi:peptide/nickel transport system substrate-binding protein
MHTAAGDQVARLRELADSGDIELDEFTQNNETGYILLHVGNEDSPVSDINVRKALAMSLDYDTYIEARSAGIFEQANGPFPPGAPGYLEETGYPDFDLEAATALVEEYEAENGPLELSYKTTPDEFNLTTAQLLQQMWEAAGIDVSLDQIEQGQFIVAALQGDFEMFGWRQHSGYDPLLQRVWWDSRNAIDPPGLALNFGRIDDEVIDENMNVVVESDDQAERTEAAENVNRRFGEQAYYLWIEWVNWGVGHSPAVHNVRGGVLPDGTPVLANEGGGAHQIAQIWIDE